MFRAGTSLNGQDGRPVCQAKRDLAFSLVTGQGLLYKQLQSCIVIEKDERGERLLLGEGAFAKVSRNASRSRCKYERSQCNPAWALFTGIQMLWPEAAC